jgi:hypothetical protein
MFRVVDLCMKDCIISGMDVPDKLREPAHALTTIEGVELYKDISVFPRVGMPIYPDIDNGMGEIVIDFGAGAGRNVWPTTLSNALVRESYDTTGIAQPDHRLARVLIDHAFDTNEVTVTLHRRGAIALRGALTSFQAMYGKDMFNGLTDEDFTNVIEQLPTDIL